MEIEHNPLEIWKTIGTCWNILEQIWKMWDLVPRKVFGKGSRRKVPSHKDFRNKVPGRTGSRKGSRIGKPERLLTSAWSQGSPRPARFPEQERFSDRIPELINDLINQLIENLLNQ